MTYQKGAREGGLRLRDWYMVLVMKRRRRRLGHGLTTMKPVLATSIILDHWLVTLSTRSAISYSSVLSSRLSICEAGDLAAAVCSGA